MFDNTAGCIIHDLFCVQVPRSKQQVCHVRISKQLVPFHDIHYSLASLR